MTRTNGYRSLSPRFSSCDRSPPRVDLFAGAGGLALGCRAASCEITAAVDAHPEAGRALEDNFHALQGERPPLALAGEGADLEQLDPVEVVTARPTDILIGGLPCLAFGLRRPVVCDLCGFRSASRARSA